jgi:hypothetical protein
MDNITAFNVREREREAHEAGIVALGQMLNDRIDAEIISLLKHASVSGLCPHPHCLDSCDVGP